MKNCLDIINERRSIRLYKDDNVKDEDLKVILESAMNAPSALNLRPWRFIVVKNKEIKAKIANAHPHAKMILQSDVALIVVALPHKQLAAARGYFPQDCAAATQNILLAATSLGYGTCWCGVYPNEERVNSLSSILNIKEGIPFCVIALGVSNESPNKRGYYDEDKVEYIL